MNVYEVYLNLFSFALAGPTSIILLSGRINLSYEKELTILDICLLGIELHPRLGYLHFILLIIYLPPTLFFLFLVQLCSLHTQIWPES